MDCECKISGWCERYKREMTGRLLEICRGDALTPERCEQYRAKWAAEAAGRPAPSAEPINDARIGGDSQRSRADKPRDRNRKRTKGLGNMVEAALSMVGITVERVERLVGRGCGCGNRKERLNRLGEWAVRVLTGQASEADKDLDAILTRD